MKKNHRSFKVGKIQVGICSLLLILCLTIPSYSWVDNSQFKVEQTEVPGITDYNNVQFAFDRYIITAPYAPSKRITDDTKLADLDNNKVRIVDAKKIANEPQIIDLKDCYFPTKVYFDAESRMLFVKGTRIVEGPGGEYEASAVIKYMRLSFPEDGKFISDVEAVTIPIEGVQSKTTTDAPDIFILSKNIFLFTNGCSIFTFSISDGYLYQVPFIAANNYDPESNAISDICLDPESRVLSIVVSKKLKVGENKWQHASELFFYGLEDDGTINQLNHIIPESFEGAAIAPGSSIAINGEGKNIGSAYFVASNGKLYQVNWNGISASAGELSEVTTLEGYSQPSGEFLSSVKTSYDKDKRVFEVLKNGNAVFIHRPLNTNGRGKIGKIHRPLNLRISVEEPALTLVQMAAKKNKVVNQKTFVTELAEQGGVSDMISDDSGNRYVATYNGNIFELSGTNEVDLAALNFLGQIGNRLSSAFYFASRNAIVGVNALEMEDERLVSPGGLSLAKRKESSNYLSLVNWAEDVLKDNAVLGLSFGSIRRPCNTRPQ
jgi:hypothetical protein